MKVFPPSTIAHPWRTSLAYFAVCFYVTLLVYWLLSGPVLVWLILRLGHPSTESQNA